MSLSTPYLMYIVSAYGITFVSLGFFLILNYAQWKRLSSDEA